MEGRILPLISNSKKERKKLKWKITEDDGHIILVEGTDILTEEETKVVHVYDEKECLLVTEYHRIEIYNDNRLESTSPPAVRPPRPVKKRTPASKKKEPK